MFISIRSVVTTIFSAATLCIVVIGCASSNTSDAGSELMVIPDRAYEVQLFSQRTPDDYIGFIRRRLEEQGFSTADFSSVNQSVRLTTAEVGRGISLMILASTEHDAVSDRTIARFRGQVGRISDDQLEFEGMAQWSDQDNREAFGFKAMTGFVSKIEHEHMEFAVQQ